MQSSDVILFGSGQPANLPVHIAGLATAQLWSKGSKLGETKGTNLEETGEID